MRNRSNENLCPRYPGHQWKQMFTFKGNKFEWMTLYNRSPEFDPQKVLVATTSTISVRVIHVRFLWLHKHLTLSC